MNIKAILKRIVSWHRLRTSLAINFKLKNSPLKSKTATATAHSHLSMYVSDVDEDFLDISADISGGMLHFAPVVLTQVHGSLYHT